MRQGSLDVHAHVEITASSQGGNSLPQLFLPTDIRRPQICNTITEKMCPMNASASRSITSGPFLTGPLLGVGGGSYSTANELHPQPGNDETKSRVSEKKLWIVRMSPQNLVLWSHAVLKCHLYHASQNPHDPNVPAKNSDSHTQNHNTNTLLGIISRTITIK